MMKHRSNAIGPHPVLFSSRGSSPNKISFEQCPGPSQVQLRNQNARELYVVLEEGKGYLWMGGTYVALHMATG